MVNAKQLFMSTNHKEFSSYWLITVLFAQVRDCDDFVNYNKRAFKNHLTRALPRRYKISHILTFYSSWYKLLNTSNTCLPNKIQLALTSTTLVLRHVCPVWNFVSSGLHKWHDLYKWSSGSFLATVTWTHTTLSELCILFVLFLHWWWPLSLECAPPSSMLPILLLLQCCASKGVMMLSCHVFLST